MKTGIFEGKYGYMTDVYLKDSLIFFFNQLPYTPSVYDFGCGDASYSKAIVNSNSDINLNAYDGNPLSPKLSGGFSDVLNLTDRINLPSRDWVICLEVGEHIPKKYESLLLDNIFGHADRGVILSWAVPGQGGRDHVNEQPNDYIISEAKSRGFAIKPEYTKALRAGIHPWVEPRHKKYINKCISAGKLYWFKNTLMVFTKLRNV